jgi:hypothetical protein
MVLENNPKWYKHPKNLQRERVLAPLADSEVVCREKVGDRDGGDVEGLSDGSDGSCWAVGVGVFPLSYEDLIATLSNSNSLAKISGQILLLSHFVK